MSFTMIVAVFISIFLCFNYKAVNHKKWGNLVKDVHVRSYYTYWDKRMFSWLYLPLFFLRRFVFIMIPLIVNHSAFQLMFLLKINLFSIYLYIHSKPHISYRRYVIEILNELIILGFTYHLISFSDFNTALDKRFDMGISNSIFLGFLIAYNLINMMISMR